MSAPRILIADDEQHIVQVLSLTLNRAGYRVVTASDGEAAWQALTHTPVDLIITDQAMPGLTGTQLTTQARALPGNEGLPVLVVTARKLPAETGQGNPANAVLPKPFSPRGVLAHVEALVGPAPHVEETSR